MDSWASAWRSDSWALEVKLDSWVWVAGFVICQVRSDSWFCDLWLARFWYGGWVFVGCDMSLNFVVVGFVGLVMLNGVAINVLRWCFGLVL